MRLRNLYFALKRFFILSISPEVARPLVILYNSLYRICIDKLKESSQSVSNQSQTPHINQLTHISHPHNTQSVCLLAPKYTLTHIEPIFDALVNKPTHWMTQPRIPSYHPNPSRLFGPYPNIHTNWLPIAPVWFFVASASGHWSCIVVSIFCVCFGFNWKAAAADFHSTSKLSSSWLIRTPG